MFRLPRSGMAAAAAMALGGAGAALAASGERNDAKRAAVLAARMPVGEAISLAERQAGGRAAKVDLEHEKAGYVYEVEVLTNDGAANVFVDPATGSVLRTDRQGEHGKTSTSEDGTSLADLTASRTTLAQAVAAAEGKTQGKAIAASFGDEDDGDGRGPLLTVDAAEQNAVRGVVVDRATGSVVKVAADNPEQEDGEHEHGGQHEHDGEDDD